MSSPGIALLGAGIFATEAHLPALAKLGAAVPPLRAVYSRSLASAAALAAAAVALHLPAPDIYHDAGPTLDALLARPDISAVLVVLPITAQPAVVLRALAAGKHVLSEKPVAADVARARALIAAYDADYAGRLLWRVAENFEAEPGVALARDAIRAGKIGDVRLFTAHVLNYIDTTSKWYKTPWRTVPDYQGGFLLDGGVHTAAILRTVLPHAPTALAGFASLAKPYLAPHDTLAAALRAGPAAHGTLLLSFAAPTPARPAADMLVVTGDAGWLSLNIVDGVFRTRITRAGAGDADADGTELVETLEAPVRGVEVEIARFFAAIAGDDAGLGDPRAALADVALIEAALTSDGAPVDLVALARV